MSCVDKKDAGIAEGQTDLLAVAVIQRLFWAAPRVRRKFGAAGGGGELRRGGFAAPSI